CPVWYRLDEHARPRYAEPLLADEAALPVDPSSDAPPGYSPRQRGQPGGFAADPDVMDTWATSSLTPQIAGDWPGAPPASAASPRAPRGQRSPGAPPALTASAASPRGQRSPGAPPALTASAASPRGQHSPGAPPALSGRRCPV